MLFCNITGKRNSLIASERLARNCFSCSFA